MPKCYVVGFVVSAVGIISFAGIIVFEILRKRRAKAAVSVVCEETAPAAEINEAAPAPEAEEKNEEK